MFENSMVELEQTIKNVYFLGIGGIGMSALARYFKAKGTKWPVMTGLFRH